MLKHNPVPEIPQALAQNITSALTEKREPRSVQEVIAEFSADQQALWVQWQADSVKRLDMEAEARLREHRHRILDAANIPGRFHGTRFDSLERKHHPKQYDLCREYAANGCTLNGKSGLMLAGAAGTGKTALALAILRDVVERECKPVRFMSMSVFLQGLRSQYDYHRDDDREPPMSLDDALRYHLIIFDDISRQRMTEWGDTAFHDLADLLYNDGARVIYTTNAQRKEFLEFVDESTASRIDEMCTRIRFGGRNLRYREGEE